MLVLCSWTKHFNHSDSASLHPGVSANLMLVDIPVMDQHPGGSRNTPSQFMLQDKLRPDGSLAQGGTPENFG